MKPPPKIKIEDIRLTPEDLAKMNAGTSGKGYGRRDDGLRSLMKPDEEKVKFLRHPDVLGPVHDNVACDGDRLQFDNVHGRQLWFEFELENKIDPWEGGSLFGGPEPQFLFRSYAFMQRWNYTVRARGCLFIVIYPSEWKRVNEGWNHVLLMEVLEADFNDVTRWREAKMTIKQFGAWLNDVNSRCKNKREQFYNHDIGISRLRNFFTTQYPAFPKEKKDDLKKDDGANSIPDQPGERRGTDSHGHGLQRTQGFLPGLGEVLDEQRGQGPRNEQPNRVAENPGNHPRLNEGHGGRTGESTEVPF